MESDTSVSKLITNFFAENLGHYDKNGVVTTQEVPGAQGACTVLFD